jgi:lysyl-tRNA synthetase class I
MTKIPDPFNTPESRAYMDEIRVRLENGHFLPFETFCPECGEIDPEGDEWLETHGTVEIADNTGKRTVTLIGCEGYHIHRDWLFATIHRDNA